MYVSKQSVESQTLLHSRFPIASWERQEILNHVHGLNLSEDDLLAQDNGFEAFFDWYGEQWEGAPAELLVTHQEVLDVITLLKSADQTRAKIIETLRRSSISKENLLDSLVTLAARVWLMLSIGTFQQSLSPSQGIIWTDDGKLGDVVAARFSPHNNLLQDQVKLPMTFTAENLERMAGIRIAWTSDLAEHLALREDDTKVVLFHQASILELHKKSQSPLSQELIEALLLPSSHGKPNKWFQCKQQEYQRRQERLDARAGLCGHLNAAARQIEVLARSSHHPETSL
ncbi:MAG: hypothetical protein M1816_006550 [Peltula sp. TS41687]|nr:MAG: hypothetical protein M1816_006550 [Peltula sp. TS41687]